MANTCLDDPFADFHSSEDEDIKDIKDGSYKCSQDNIFDKSYKLVSIENEEPVGKWYLSPMYKTGMRGQELFYQIGFDGENVITVHGEVGGELQKFPKKVELTTRSKSIDHQAMIRARFLFRKYYRQNYRPKGSTYQRIKEPMLAHPIKDAATCQIPVTFPVALERKLDGLRIMFEMAENGDVTARSRGGIYYTQYKHITDVLRDFFSYLPPNTMLDAEVYKHGMKREEISGTTRTINFEHEAAIEMKAYIFDAMFEEELPYETRKEKLQNIYQLFIKDHFSNDKNANDYIPFELIDYIEAYSWDEVYKFYEDTLADGYEGVMVKRMFKGTNVLPAGKRKKAWEYSLYHGGRSHRCYKIKECFDEEGIIIAVVPCTGKEKNCAKLTLIDPRGNIMSVRPKGSYENREEMLRNKDYYIGKLYTYEYTGLTKYNVADHPRGVRVREDLDTAKIVLERRKVFAAKGICLCSYLENDGCICDSLLAKRKKIVIKKVS